jgi:hypothetical protein
MELPVQPDRPLVPRPGRRRAEHLVAGESEAGKTTPPSDTGSLPDGAKG